MSRHPNKIAGIYWTRWNYRIPLRAVPSAYNVVYLFAATTRGGDGAIRWGRDNVAADIRVCRARGQRVLLSVGGSGQDIDFSSRSVSARFVAALERINDELGGSRTSPMIDGLDLNTYESAVEPDVLEYMWISEQLKGRFGSDFLVTSPPAAPAARDKAFCRAMLATGAMDYVSPQFYGGPGLSDPDYIVRETGVWVRDVAQGDATRIVVGFGMEDLPHYSTIDEILVAWQQVQSAHPSIRGAFLWQHQTDADRDWVFARQVVPLIAPVTI